MSFDSSQDDAVNERRWAGMFGAPIKQIGDYEVHEAAWNYSSVASNEDEEALAESLKEQGLVKPIELYDGKVIDGRSRLRGCLKVGVKPRFVDVTSKVDDPFLYVHQMTVRRNETKRQLLFRRSMLESYRAMRGGDGDLATCETSKVAESAGVSVRQAHRARSAVQNETPEAIEAIASNDEISLRSVDELRKYEPDPEKRQEAFLEGRDAVREIIRNGKEKEEKVVTTTKQDSVEDIDKKLATELAKVVRLMDRRVELTPKENVKEASKVRSVLSSFVDQYSFLSSYRFD